MKLTNTFIALAMSSLAISGCSSSSGGGSTTTSPDGIYNGTITGGDTALNGGEKAIVYNNRLMMISLPGEIQQLFNIPLTLDVNNISSTTAQVYASSATLPNAVLSVTGSFIEETSISANFEATSGNTSTYTNGSINLSFNRSTYERDSSMSLISGNWSGPFGFAGDTRLTFDTNGNITGDDDASCTFSGTFSIPDTSINVYDISLNTTGGCSTMPDDTYTGYAWIEDNNGTDSLIFIISAINGSRGVIMTK